MIDRIKNSLYSVDVIAKTVEIKDDQVIINNGEFVINKVGRSYYKGKPTARYTPIACVKFEMDWELSGIELIKFYGITIKEVAEKTYTPNKVVSNYLKYGAESIHKAYRNKLDKYMEELKHG